MTLASRPWWIAAVALTAWFALGISRPAAAIPPPVEQFLADCESSTYASDVVVCGDDALLRMDRELGELYERLRDRLEPGGSGALLDPRALLEPQDAWFRRRSLCAFSPHQPDCLRAAYGERLKVLKALDGYRQQPPAETLEGICREAPWGLAPTVISATQVGEIILAAPSGRVRAVAVGDLPRDDWIPYLRHEAEGSQLRLFPLEGPVVTCELRQPQPFRP